MDKKSTRERLLEVTFKEVYKHGYAGASIATILKVAKVPKGSMYHHFSSKKAMVIAMIEEILTPKVRDSFFIKLDDDSRALDIIIFLFKKISKNEMLITHGCPLHKLMFEMGSLDEDITNLCHNEFINMQNNFIKIIELGKKRGEIIDANSKSLAKFIIISTWGALSIAPKYSSKKQFLKDTQHIIDYIREN